MSEIGNQILTRFDKVENDPAESFPWESGGWHRCVDDADGKLAFDVYGYGGSCAEGAPGIAERKRILYQVHAMIELVREVAYGIHYCPKEMVETARRIMARIEGRTI